MSDNFFEPIKVVTPSQMEFANEQVDPTVRGDFIDYSRAKLQQGFNSGLTGSLVDFSLTKLNESQNPELAVKKFGKEMKTLYPYGNFDDGKEYSIAEAITNQNRAIVNDIANTLAQRQEINSTFDFAASVASGFSTDLVGFGLFAGVAKATGMGLSALSRAGMLSSKLEGSYLAKLISPTTRGEFFAANTVSNVGTSIALTPIRNELFNKISERETYGAEQFGMDVAFGALQGHFAYKLNLRKLQEIHGEPMNKVTASEVVARSVENDLPVTKETKSHYMPETGPKAPGYIAEKGLSQELNAFMNKDGDVSKISGKMYADLNSGETTAGPGVLLSNNHFEGAVLVDFKNMNMIDGYHNIKTDNSILDQLIKNLEKSDNPYLKEKAADLADYLSEVGDKETNYHKFFHDIQGFLDDDMGLGAKPEDVSLFEATMREAFIKNGIDGYKTENSAVLFNTQKAKTDITAASAIDTEPIPSEAQAPLKPIDIEAETAQKMKVIEDRKVQGESSLDPITMQQVADYESSLLSTELPDMKKIDDPKIQIKEIETKIEDIKESIAVNEKAHNDLVQEILGNERKMYQGRGNTPEQIYGAESVANGSATPLFGDGQYYANNPQDAKFYGDVTEHNVIVNNPRILKNTDDFLTLIHEAGVGKYLDNRQGHYYQHPEQRAYGTRLLNNYLMKRGYDGVIVRMDTFNYVDVDGKSTNFVSDKAKQLMEMVGHDQTVVFKNSEQIAKLNLKENLALKNIDPIAKEAFIQESEYYAKVQERVKAMEYSKREQETLMKAFTNCILRGI